MYHSKDNGSKLWFSWEGLSGYKVTKDQCTLGVEWTHHYTRDTNLSSVEVWEKAILYDQTMWTKVGFLDLNTNRSLFISPVEILRPSTEKLRGGGWFVNIKVSEVKQWRGSHIPTWINLMCNLLHRGFESKIWISKMATYEFPFHLNLHVWLSPREESFKQWVGLCRILQE
jgi:hypothetical protein